MPVPSRSRSRPENAKQALHLPSGSAHIYASVRSCSSTLNTLWRCPKCFDDLHASHLLTAGIAFFPIMIWMGHAPTSVAMFRKRYARYLGDSKALRREPVQLDSWAVPPDLRARGDGRAYFGHTRPIRGRLKLGNQSESFAFLVGPRATE